MNQQVFELMAKESGGTSAKQTEEKICPRCGLALKRETEDLAGSGDAPVSRIADIRKMYKKKELCSVKIKLLHAEMEMKWKITALQIRPKNSALR